MQAEQSSRLSTDAILAGWALNPVQQAFLASAERLSFYVGGAQRGARRGSKSVALGQNSGSPSLFRGGG